MNLEQNDDAADFNGGLKRALRGASLTQVRARFSSSPRICSLGPGIANARVARNSNARQGKCIMK
jgi:hypothetical protein